MSSVLHPPHWICAICGCKIPSGYSHTCAGGIPASNLPIRNEPVYDTTHWLYKAGYEQGRQDERAQRDLSPGGRS